MSLRERLAPPSLKRESEALEPLSPSSPLPVSTADVLGDLSPQKVVSLETTHGNGDLIKVLDILGIGGPFHVTSPWELRDERGRHLINAGGYAALPFGEMYPPLVDFMHLYLERNRSMSLPQQSASAWRAALETNLVALLAQDAPSHADSQVFLSNSGAEAVEAAVKFAKAARPKAKYLINFSGAYHGKTAGALSLTPNEAYQKPFRPLVPGVETLPYGNAGILARTLLNLGADNVVAIVLEPVQGEAGVITPPPDFLPAVQALKEKYNLLVIADEIQSGLGRTGHLFASVAGGLEPDIITLAKPLGGGLVPIGATISRKAIVKKALGGLEAKRHSNTFGGGSLAAAVGLKSLEIIVEEGLVERARVNGERGLARLRAIQKRYPGYVKEVRASGMLFALQLRHVVKPGLLAGQTELANQFGTGLAMRTMHLHGVHVCFTLNASQVIRLTPALNLPDELFDELFNRVENAAKANRNAWQMLPKTPVTRLARLARLALE